jgi:hypothetical protein
MRCSGFWHRNSRKVRKNCPEPLGDRAMLNLEKYQEIRIFSLRQFHLAIGYSRVTHGKRPSDQSLYCIV